MTSCLLEVFRIEATCHVYILLILVVKLDGHLADKLIYFVSLGDLGLQLDSQ